MDVVIPFRHSNNRDQELRYALRSIELHIHDVENVFIIGDPPKIDLKDVIYIPAKDLSKSVKHKEQNIYNKLLIACNDLRVSDDFILNDDDTCLLSKFMGAYYHKGPIFSAPGDYGRTEKNTLSLLGNRINNFNVHCPRVFNKELFKRSLSPLNWAIPYGYQINTVYAVLNGIKGEYTEDNKGLSIEGKSFFSLGDALFRAPRCQQLLKTIFPKSSRYEKN